MNEEQLTQNTEGGSPPASALLGSLLSNPDLIRRVGAMLATASSEQEKTPVDGDAEAIQAEPPPSPTGTTAQDGLSALLADPTMLEKLPQIIAVMKPLLTSLPVEKASTEAVARHSPDANRDQLLLALKPFLSRQRCDAIDSMLRIAKLGALFQQLR